MSTDHTPADELRAVVHGAFAGSSAASARVEIGGCSPKNAREPGKAGVAGSIPARSTITPVVLFAEVEIVSALPEDVVIDVEAVLWCDACNGPLREDLIEAGEDLCDSCFEEASYER